MSGFCFLFIGKILSCRYFITYFLMPKSSIILLALLEGFTVLSVEILGAKMITPYYGASIFIWTIVLGITMISLAIGYYFGSWLSQKNNPKQQLFILLQITTLLIALMPFTIHPLFRLVKIFDIYTGAFTLSVFVLTAPLIVISAASPLLIQMGTTTVKMSGKQAGFIFAASTIGGIFASFFITFYLIEKIGITLPCLLLALLILLLSNLLLFNKKYLIVFSLEIVSAVLFLVFFISKKQFNETSNIRIAYRKEGVFGQLTVLENMKNDTKSDFMPSRSLLINNISQSYCLLNPYLVSLWKYPHLMSVYASLKPSGSSALLLGMGAGVLATELTRLGFTIDVVDIDKRMYDIAKNYFSFDDTKTNFMVDDARHFIKKNNGKYDIIMIDLLNAEVQPNHFFTLQSFKELKKLMHPSSLLIINFQGYSDIKYGGAFRSIYKTMLESGFYSYFYGENPMEMGDIFFIASLQPVQFNFDKNRINRCCFTYKELNDFLSNPAFTLDKNKLKDAFILNDDQPLLDILNVKSILEWRESMIKSFAQKEMEEGVNLFR